MTPGAVLVARPCDFCGVRALCIPIVDQGDGAVMFACGRCASSGKTTDSEARAEAWHRAGARSRYSFG